MLYSLILLAHAEQSIVFVEILIRSTDSLPSQVDSTPRGFYVWVVLSR